MKSYLKTCLLTVAAFVLCLLVFPTSAQAASVDDLEFTMHYEGIQYHITGCNKDATGDLVIPETYKGLPIAWINYGAFSGCDKLTSVTIPDTVTELGMEAFSGCDNLTSVTIGNGVEIIDWRTFSGCPSLKEVTFGSNVKTIAYNAFGYCTGLKSITIPDSVTCIEEQAFRDCTALTDIDFGKGVTDIGAGAFTNCIGLTAVTLPDNVVNIGSGIFSGCNGLQSIKTGNGITAISTNAFYNCVRLTEVKIGSGVTTIGSRAFENCTGLQSITIPKNVQNFDGWCFEGCSNLRSITLEKGITGINEYAFAGCTALQSITIPDTVTTIKERAFEGCNSLQSITIGKGVAEIGSWAFIECESLKEVYISDLEAWCNIKYDIGGNPLESGCDLYLHGVKVTDLVIPSTLIQLSDNAFSECTSITSVYIPGGINTIPYHAFNHIETLTDVIIESGVTDIEGNGLANCSNMKNLVLPSTVTNIANYAFDRDVFVSELADLTVWYMGSEQQKNAISIGYCNSNLTNATWHYNVTMSQEGDQQTYRCGDCGETYEFTIAKMPTEPKPEVKFEDISSTSWQFSAAKYAVEKNLMAGKGTDKDGNIIFDPNSPISREEFVQVLYNAEGKPSVSIANNFPDVKDAWYKNAVLWANSMNIASGMGNGNFGVGKSITRQDLAVLLYKYAAMKTFNTSANTGEINRYADGSKVSDYAKAAMDWAVTKGVMSGKGTAGDPISSFRLDPAGTATRAECAAMLKNFMENVWVDEKQ